MNLHICLKRTLLKWKELSKENIITNIRAFFLNNKYYHVPCGFNASMDNCPAWTSSPQMGVKHEIKHVWSEDTPKNGSFRQASPKRYLNQRILRLAGSESQTQKIHNLTLPSPKWQSTFLWSKLSVLAPSDTDAQKNCSCFVSSKKIRYNDTT